MFILKLLLVLSKFLLTVNNEILNIHIKISRNPFSFPGHLGGSSWLGVVLHLRREDSVHNEDGKSLELVLQAPAC